MNFPDHITTREVMHGTGRGFSFYVMQCVEVPGIHHRMERNRNGWRESFKWDGLPGLEFGAYDLLRTAASAVSDEAYSAVMAEYPKLTFKPDPCGNSCRLCPRPSPVAGMREPHRTARVEIALSWHRSSWCSLCEAHMTQYHEDAAGLLAALEREVAERRARARTAMAEIMGVIPTLPDPDCPF